MDPVLFISPVAGLLGVAVGAKLNERSALRAVRDERRWSSSQLVQQRKEEAAARLDEDILKASEEFPRGTILASESMELLSPMHTELNRAWTRSAVLDDADLQLRFKTLDMLIFMASRADQGRPGEAELNINLYPIEVAGTELRAALAAYQRREQPPPAEMPPSSELIRIAHRGGGSDFGRIHLWMIDHDVGA